VSTEPDEFHPPKTQSISIIRHDGRDTRKVETYVADRSVIDEMEAYLQKQAIEFLKENECRSSRTER
jgi:hypothetical protein